MAIEVTKEMRQAVYAADCQEQGHQPDFQSTLGGSWGRRAEIGGPDENTLPHVRCMRCGAVWLLWPEEFPNYDAALATLKGFLKNPEYLKPRPWSQQARELRAAGGHSH